MLLPMLWPPGGRVLGHCLWRCRILGQDPGNPRKGRQGFGQGQCLCGARLRALPTTMYHVCAPGIRRECTLLNHGPARLAFEETSFSLWTTGVFRPPAVPVTGWIMYCWILTSAWGSAGVRRVLCTYLPPAVWVQSCLTAGSIGP